MNKIETKVLNPWVISDAEQMMVCAARLTQRGQVIKNMEDFENLFRLDYKEETLKNMATLPHPTIQKFAVINAVVVGASRRFLAQITRHQSEVKFMSASLQYSDYSGKASYVVPYQILGTSQESGFLAQCEAAMQKYMSLINAGVNNDDAGYLVPQSLRNVLIISATPYQWKHMINQRICRRNSPETRYVMLKIWKELSEISPALFSDCGSFCMTEYSCKEGKMACGNSMVNYSGRGPDEILKADFPKLCG